MLTYLFSLYLTPFVGDFSADGMMIIVIIMMRILILNYRGCCVGLFRSSRAQQIVDAGEDDIPHTQRLSLAGLGATRITSRIYDLTELRELDLSDNKLWRMSPNLQYLTQVST